jgi:hypothetical protein
MGVGYGSCLGILVGGTIGVLAGYLLSGIILFDPFNPRSDFVRGLDVLMPMGLEFRCFGACIGFPLGASIGTGFGALLDWRFGRGNEVEFD